jgi:hypothetical protein
VRNRVSRGVPALAALLLAAAAVDVMAACGDFTSTADPGDGATTTDGAGAADGGDGGSTGQGDGAVVPARDGSPTPDGGPGSPCPPTGTATAADCPIGDGGALWNGRCYFVLRPLRSPVAAAAACMAAGAQIATFTCDEEWTAAAGLFPSNFWLGGKFESAGWAWSTGEPFGYWPSGGPFDGSAPPSGSDCLLADKNGAWIPTTCSASSAGAYCERH